MSARYYLKNLMGTRRNGAITVSEFVALASPNHGIASAFLVGATSPTRRTASAASSAAGRTAVVTVRTLRGCGPLNSAVEFTNNQAGDDSFLSRLNGHPLADSCRPARIRARRRSAGRPRRRRALRQLVRANNTDELVGGRTQSGDCFGRRLARNLAPDADNREITGVPSLDARELPAPLADHLHGAADGGGPPGAGPRERLHRAHPAAAVSAAAATRTTGGSACRAKSTSSTIRWSSTS